STHGVHAGCIEDVWQVAIEIASRAGGDRGCPGLYGPPTPPEAVKPQRLIVLETEGWPEVDAATRAAFEALLKRLSDRGIALLRRADDAAIEALERAIGDARRIGNAITAWENRWTLRNLVDQYPDGVSARTQQTLAT